MKEINSNCGVYQSRDSNSFFLFLFNHSAGGESRIDITAVLNSANYTNSSSFALAEDCSSLRVNNAIYRLNTATRDSYSPISNMAADWTASDQDFNYILRKGREIWKYNPTANAFGLYFTFNKTLGNAYLRSHSHRIVVASLSSDTQMEIFAIHSLNSIAKMLFSQSVSDLASPSVKFSPKLTKIMVYGYDSSNSSRPKTVLLYVDYDSRSGGTLNIDDFIYQYDGERDFECIGDSFVYFRVLKSNATDNAEALYYFAANRKVYRVFSKAVVSVEGLSWTNSVLQVGATLEDVTVLSVFKSEHHLSIFRVEANANLLQVNSKNYDFGVAIIDGRRVKCPLGCSDCSMGVCESCLDGFAFHNASK